MARRSVLPAGAPLLAIAAVALVAGCSAAGAPGSSQSTGTRVASRSCGSARTAAGVKVLIVIRTGQVACATAQAVERDYAAAIAAGRVPGNGGGAPVNVHGWICQGFSTPEVLRTGNASRCTRDGAEILAVLPSPASLS